MNTYKFKFIVSELAEEKEGDLRKLIVRRVTKEKEVAANSFMEAYYIFSELAPMVYPKDLSLIGVEKKAIEDGEFHTLTEDEVNAE